MWGVGEGGGVLVEGQLSSGFTRSRSALKQVVPGRGSEQKPEQNFAFPWGSSLQLVPFGITL